MGYRIAGDATLIQAQLQDKEAAYNGYYRKHCYLVHRLVCARTNLTLKWIGTPGNVDEAQLMLPLLVKAMVHGIRPEEAVFDNGYAGYWNYEIPNLLLIKTRIGFRRNARPNWRGKPKTLRLCYKKMVKAGKLDAQKLEELSLHPDPERNSLEDILCALAVTGQHEYVGAYYRNQSLAEFHEDRRGWLKRYSPLRSMIEGAHGHQKDWLDLDDLREKGLRKATLHVALCMLSEAAVAYTKVQNGTFRALTSQAYLN
ncbi:transposase [Candidatus Bathyarchaeota archaeon]|nr:transposase [Candidatus Bathyarchaeota archaeon]